MAHPGLGFQRTAQYCHCEFFYKILRTTVLSNIFTQIKLNYTHWPDIHLDMNSEQPTTSANVLKEIEVVAPKYKELFEKGRTLFEPEKLAAKKPLHILFVVPPVAKDGEYGRLSKFAGELPWLGTAYVAAAARKVGHKSTIIDYEAARQGYAAVRADIERLQPDLVAMALFITNTDKCLEVAKIAKSVNPKIKVVLGGPQATIFPDEAIAHEEIDCLFYSEAEISFCNFLNVFHEKEKWSDVRGIIYRDASQKVVKTPRQPLIDDLDTVPPPALDLYDLNQYSPTPQIRGRKVANLVTSRGCPYTCSFCEAKMTFGRTFRHLSPEVVMSQLNFMNKTWGIDSFQFWDDIFTTDRKRVIELCKKMIDNPIHFKWMCWTRTDLVDSELLGYMKRAGCYLIFFGCESGSQKLLDRIRKKLTVAQNYEGIRLTREAGILAQSSFMVGLPGETPEETQATVEFTLKSNLDWMTIGIMEPYPGTDMWNDALKSGYFMDTDSQYNNILLTNFSKIWVPHGRTRKELEDAVHQAMRRFYLRPRQILQYVFNIPHAGWKRTWKMFSAGVDYFLFARFRNIKTHARY